jgi:hypothetical protein
MSEATYDSLEGEAYEGEGEAYEGEAYEGEAYEGEAGYEAYGEDARSRADRRYRRRQIMLARQRQLQRQPRVSPYRPAPPPRPARVDGAPRPAPATLNAIRAVDLDAKVAQDSLRRQLDRASRRATRSMYSALATGAVSQALDTYAENLEPHPFVRAAVRWAPLALLPADKERRGVEAVALHPAFISGALIGGIFLIGKFTTDQTREVAEIRIQVPSKIVANDEITLSAVAVDDKGRPVTGVQLIWDSSDQDRLRLLDPAGGRFKAAAAGDVEVTVKVNGKTEVRKVKVE